MNTPLDPSELETTPAEAERADQSTLGSMLINPAIVKTAVQIMKPEYYSSDAHPAIHSAIADLHAAGSVIDAVTVPAELDRRGELASIVGAAYLGERTNRGGAVEAEPERTEHG